MRKLQNFEEPSVLKENKADWQQQFVDDPENSDPSPSTRSAS